MNRMRIDWRWVAVIGVVAALANSRSLPWPVVSAMLVAVGGYIGYLGWTSLGYGRSSGRRVTYWRGQKYELLDDRRSLRVPRWRELLPMLPHAVLGLALILAGVAVLTRGLGL